MCDPSQTRTRPTTSLHACTPGRIPSRTLAHLHTRTHVHTQELLGLYDTIERTKKMGIVYGDNTVTNTVPGTSAERQGVKSGWRIAVVHMHACMLHTCCVLCMDCTHIARSGPIAFVLHDIG